MSKAKITFAQYQEAANTLEIKTGKILSAETFKENKDHVYKMQVDFGDEDIRTVITSIGNDFSAEELKGRLFPFVTNLEPAKQYGILSEAMIIIPTKGDEVRKTFGTVGTSIL